MEEGEILIDSIEPISLQDVTHDLAIESGFESRADLLKVAKHGAGDNVYLVRFRYVLPSETQPREARPEAGRVVRAPNARL
jgi:hypothetical protein